MSTGNLIGQRVREEFWPRCGNCQYHNECAIRPRHPAYPHTWHWSHEGIPLGDGTQLITDSWVGTIAKSQPHTGCYHYSVNPEQTYPLTNAMKKLLELHQLKAELFYKATQQSAALEYEGHWNELERIWDEHDRVEAEYERLLREIAKSLKTEPDSNNDE